MLTGYGTPVLGRAGSRNGSACACIVGRNGSVGAYGPGIPGTSYRLPAVVAGGGAAEVGGRGPDVWGLGAAVGGRTAVTVAGCDKSYLRPAVNAAAVGGRPTRAPCSSNPPSTGS